MSTIVNDTNIALIKIHEETKKEWVSLKEIYEKVEEIRGSKNANNGASIRAAIETHCKDSSAFRGDELYISKGIGTGLYKSIYYDRIEFINNMNIGDVFTRDQLMAIFKVSGQAGIMKTNSLNALVLTTSEESVYGDSLIESGTIQYTGEGLEGDQTITKNNKTLYHSKENDLPVYLFTKDKKRRYTFEGRVELYDSPYQVKENDINGKERLVWKFPLAIIYPEDYDYTKDEKYNEVVYEIEKIEDKVYSEMNSDSNELEFKEGKLNIRKYRKTNKKVQRAKKPDYIAEEIIKTKQGIINEKAIYEIELKRLMEEEAKEQTKKMKEFFMNKKENEGYDILSFELDENGNYIEKYIEVKSTKGNEGTPIDITIDEINFAKNHIDNYYIYRIWNSDNKNRSFKIIKGRDLFDSLGYEFIPIHFKIYSK